jgi:hypothetical protein
MYPPLAPIKPEQTPPPVPANPVPPSEEVVVAPIVMPTLPETFPVLNNPPPVTVPPPFRI